MKYPDGKYRNTLVGLAALLLLGAGTVTSAATGQESAGKAEEAQLQARLEVDYERAMSEAEHQKIAAEASVKQAREQLQVAAEQQESARQSKEARAQREAELSKMHQELNRTHRELQETTRELARVNREIARAQADRHATHYAVRSSSRPVIGVILGNPEGNGVEVIGVSPDGPSERAGIKKGDVIVAVEGRDLSKIRESGDARDGLRIALRDMEADKPLTITVERENRMLDITLLPEVREPMSWQSVTRFPSAPSAPHLAASASPASAPEAPRAPEKVIKVERIVVPEIDTDELTMQIEQMRAEIEDRLALQGADLDEADGELELELHELSELGSFALQDANVWIGLPLAQGLKLAEIEPGLGEYFKTDRGVLVLNAMEDNDLQLRSGDVILQVGDTEVNSPAEFMRALRAYDSGDELVMDIKRNRKNRTLKTVMPEDRTSFFSPSVGNTHTFTITSSSH